jgi:hypothetical protein
VRGGFFAQNRLSVYTLGLSLLYLALAVTTHIVFLGIAPAIATVRAFQRKERLAPAALAAAAVTIIIGIAVFRR